MHEKYATDRLLIHSLSSNDAGFILALTNSPGWLQFIGDRNIHSTEDAEKYIDKIRSNAAVTYGVVRLKDGDIPIGLITLIKRNYLDYPDFGFAFLPQYNNQGYATEAASKVLLALASEFPVLVALTLRANTASIHLLEKLGFVFEKEAADDGEILMQYTITYDAVFINHLTQQFYNAFTNIHGRKPHLQTIYDYCIPETTIVKKTGNQQEVYNLPSFIAPRQLLLTNGTLQHFQEKETAQNTVVLGNIAQRQSRYFKTGILNGERFEQYGNKLLQYIKTANGWRISAVVWEIPITNTALCNSILHNFISPFSF